MLACAKSGQLNSRLLFCMTHKKINPFLCQKFITNFGKCHKNATFKLTSCQTYGTIYFKSLSTSVHCMNTQPFGKGGPPFPLWQLGSCHNDLPMGQIYT